jgi:predicted nucleotidyltransferase
MAADLSRYDDWLAFLAALPDEVPALQVVVVNGSAVTGGWDEHSDLDVEAWCRGDAAPTYDAVLALARERFAVDHVWELPEATWPTGRQCFIHLQPDAADLSRPTRLVDVVIQTTPERLTLDTRRHGVPMVLHDPDGLLLLEDDDEAEMEAARRQAVEQAAARRQTGAWLVERAIARGDLAEATSLHLRLAVEPLVRLLRIQHCPARHDFGLRYLRTDLPAGMAEQVEALLPGPDLAVRTRAAFAWQDEVLRQLT